MSIKGPLLAEQGLRDREWTSVDADILVSPSEFLKAQSVLEKHGWIGYGESTAPHLYPSHSVTLRHPVWPIEVDLHRSFPGLLRDPEVVFATLWSRRENWSWMRQQVGIPHRADHLIIAGLHLLRDARNPGLQSDLLALVERWQSEGRSGYGVQLAAQHLGAGNSAEPLLRLLKLEPLPDVGLDADLRRAWARRTSARTTTVVPWILEMGRGNLRSALRVFMRAIWIEHAELERQHSRRIKTREALILRTRRLIRGTLTLPSALRDLWELRRDED